MVVLLKILAVTAVSVVAVFILALIVWWSGEQEWKHINRR